MIFRLQLFLTFLYTSANHQGRFNDVDVNGAADEGTELFIPQNPPGRSRTSLCHLLNGEQHRHIYSVQGHQEREKNFCSIHTDQCGVYRYFESPSLLPGKVCHT